MSWKEYIYACELYQHKRELNFEQTRLAISWIVSHQIGVRRKVKGEDVIRLKTIDKPKKVYPKPTIEEQQRQEEEGRLIWQAIQEQLKSKN